MASDMKPGSKLMVAKRFQLFERIALADCRITVTLHERHVVSNYRSFYYVFNSLCTPTWKKHHSPRYRLFVRVTGEFPAQRASKAEKASIWWRHRGMPSSDWISAATAMTKFGCRTNIRLLYWTWTGMKKEIPTECRSRFNPDQGFKP